ncbi:hypothetical protein FACS189455_2700 [Bacteroidia bacterium]|nr:hypothetical protein FACS189455_2700 [Bacteroidia bacterium]
MISESKQVEGVEMRYPFRICMNNASLYIMDLHAATYYCHRFKYPSMEYVTSFGKRGEAPDEFLDAENIRLDRFSNIWFLDANKNQIVCFNQNSHQRVIKLDKQLVRSLDFDFYGDSVFVVPDYSGTHRFHLVNFQGEIVSSRGSLPVKEKDKNIPDIVYAQAWRSFLNYNRHNDVLALVTQLGEVIELYSLGGDSLICTIKGKHGDPVFRYSKGYAIPTGIMGYSDVFVGDKYVYALFWGHSFDDLKREIVTVEGGNQIHVFDLAGNPVKCYHLERYITGFCVDEKHSVILGLDVNSDQPVVECKIAE